MSQLIDQKSMLAKLMASENIRIEHLQIETASFDPTNRVMYLPTWKDMKTYLYDLLTGHECGHALYTPAEGWHGEVHEKGMNYKNFLNVVEDARIEKKIQRKYPGLRKSFMYAYSELRDRDFFGVASKNINSLPFIDRLNLYTKSQYTMTEICFSKKEQSFVDRVKLLETWEDVVSLTDEIFEYSKIEQKELKSKQKEEEYDLEESFDDFDKQDSEFEDELTERSFEEHDESEESDNNDLNEESYILREKESTAYTHDDDNAEPKCETDENFRKNESQLVSHAGKKNVYLKFPKPNLENIVTPYKRVHELMSECFYDKQGLGSFANSLLKEFKQTNERYVSLLSKEFEMRKAAKSYDKRKISDTGDLDISKLSSYKFEDNIFRKMMRMPKGKSHGLVLLLDFSGSMCDNMAGSIDQILVLSMFCKKVNIPFVVYSFGNNVNAYYADKGVYDSFANNHFFSNQNSEYLLGIVSLREYLSSDMSSAEYNVAMKNLVMLKRTFENGRTYAGDYFYRPVSEQMSNTPLTEAIVAISHITKKFKYEKNLDITNLVIVHDGDADKIAKYKDKDGNESYISDRHDTTFVYDETCNFQKRVDYSLMNVALEWFKAYTKSNVFGFYIMSSYRYDLQKTIYKKYTNKENVYEDKVDVTNKLLKEKFIISYNEGYEHFYFILNSALKIENDELVIVGNVTTSKLKNAFMKMNKKKQVSRTLVSKFIEGIAT